MSYHGDIFAGATIRFAFNTIASATGAPITLAGTPTIRVYKDDSTTEDDSGITLNVDFDSITGMHLVEIDTSADGTFYAAGSDYFVKINAGTVDGVSVVGTVVGHFSIQNRPVNLTKINGTAASTDADLVDDITAAVLAGVVDASGGDDISVAKALEMLAAFISGKVTVSSAAGVSTYTYTKHDGTTASFTSLCNETTGLRASVGDVTP